MTAGLQHVCTSMHSTLRIDGRLLSLWPSTLTTALTSSAVASSSAVSMLPPCALIQKPLPMQAPSPNRTAPWMVPYVSPAAGSCTQCTQGMTNAKRGCFSHAASMQPYSEISLRA